MFQLTLLDHIRLTFGQVIHHHKAHEQIAERLARRLWQVRLAELVLLSGTVATAVRAMLADGGPWPALTVGFAIGALALYTLALTWQLESRLHAHRSCGTELWLIREQYYALLSELADGLIDVNTVLARRDRLMRDLRDLYAHAPLLDRPAYRSAQDAIRLSDEDQALTDEEIDRFLPKSLRKPAEPADTTWPEAPAESAPEIVVEQASA